MTAPDTAAPGGSGHHPRRNGDTEMTDTLQWHSLHGWEPTEGTWAILWPGHYGPFTACWINGRWTMCEDIDFNNATVGVEIDLPHLATDAVPRVVQSGYSIPQKVGDDSAKMIAQFMRDCNEGAIEHAGIKLVMAIKARVRKYQEAAQ